MPVLTFQGKKVHIMIVPYLSYTLDLWAESSWVLDVWVCQGGPQFSLPLRAMPETIGSWLRQCGCRLLQHNGPTALRRSASSFHGAPTHTSCLLCFASSGQPAVRSSECMPLHPLLHRGVPSVLVEQLGRGARVECSSHPKCCWPIVTSRCDQLLCLIQRERVAPSKRSGCPLEWPLAPPTKKGVSRFSHLFETFVRQRLVVVARPGRPLVLGQNRWPPHPASVHLTQPMLLLSGTLERHLFFSSSSLIALFCFNSATPFRSRRQS